MGFSLMLALAAGTVSAQDHPPDRPPPMNKTLRSSLTAFALAALAVTVQAQSAKSASGSVAGLTWTATSLLTGADLGGTGSEVSAGSALYHPSFPGFGGVVGLLMQTAQGGFICSGTLLPDRRSVLTAGHCVSDGAGTANPISTTVFFQPPAGLAPAASLYNNTQATAVAVTDYFVHPNYTGQVIDQNDIAVVRLASAAPDWATAHDIHTGAGLQGQAFEVAGYGRLGGGSGANASTGRLRVGQNSYDYAWGDAAFGGFFTDVIDGENFFGTAEIAFSLVSDFDNGSALNDTAGRIAQAVGAGSVFDHVGLGSFEAGVAGGDSGGPNFINGRVSAVNSYGLSFGTAYGDVNGTLNSSFGEFSGYVPTFIHAEFIYGAMVSAPIPEPGTYGLMALGLLGLAGVVRRRRA